jgi:hypothetical protein
MSLAVSDEELQRTIDAVISAKITPPPRRTARVLKHSGRRNAKAERFTCQKVIYCPLCSYSLAIGKGGSGACHDAAIFFPPGVPIYGCGRIFATRKGLEVLHPKNFDDTTQFPYGCLSDILPADERKVK